jgi:hypothetical protein
VIGAPDRDELDDAAQRAEGRLAREFNVTIRSQDWWREGTDASMPTSPGVPWSPSSVRRKRDELGNGKRAHPGTAGELGQVPPDSQLARRMLADARRHLVTAATAQSTEDPGPSEDDVKDAIRVAREVNEAADKVLESGVLSPW